MTWAELNEVRDLKKAIEDIEKELERLHFSESLNIPKLDGMPKSTSLNSIVERTAIRVADTEKRLEKLKNLHKDAVPRLERKINDAIEDSTARTLFIFRYVDCMYFREIGFILGYSEAHIYYLHRITGEKIISDWA